MTTALPCPLRVPVSAGCIVCTTPGATQGQLACLCLVDRGAGPAKGSDRLITPQVRKAGLTLNNSCGSYHCWPHDETPCTASAAGHCTGRSKARLTFSHDGAPRKEARGAPLAKTSNNWHKDQSLGREGCEILASFNPGFGADTSSCCKSLVYILSLSPLILFHLHEIKPRPLTLHPQRV